MLDGVDERCASDLVLDSYCVAGTPKTCSKTYTVVSNDYCSLVESKNSISDATLKALNPWLDANCGQSFTYPSLVTWSDTFLRSPSRTTSLCCVSTVWKPCYLDCSLVSQLSLLGSVCTAYCLSNISLGVMAIYVSKSHL